MDTIDLSQRRQELERRAEEQGIDIEESLGELPREDDSVMVAALATLLGLNIRAAFDESMELDEVVRTSEERREGQLTPEVVDRFARELTEAREHMPETGPERRTKRTGKGGA